MTLSVKLDQLHAEAKANKWLRYFAVFNRVALALGFIIAGMVKIMGERFASGLAVNHPMGHYLEALHHTGYYYTFIGYAQVAAAILLLIPRTAVLGALLYFPIIVNICILSLAVRFDGSLLSSPLMVLSNLFLLCWYYDRIKYILPFKQSALPAIAPRQPATDRKFPFRFFGGVIVAILIVGFTLTNVYELRPRNTLAACKTQCGNAKNPNACNVFCECIHNQGQPLDKSLDAYDKAVKENPVKRWLMCFQSA